MNAKWPDQSWHLGVSSLGTADGQTTDLQFEVRERKENDGGRVHVEGSYIMDGYSRRVLGLHLWGAPPTAEELSAFLGETALRYGLPAVLHVGGGESARPVAECIARAGVLDVLLPTTASDPGCGRVSEWLRRHLQAGVLSRLPGYRSAGATTEWSAEELLTLAGANERARNWVEAVYNRKVDSLNRMQAPQGSGGRGFSPSPVSILPLFPRQDGVTLRRSGVPYRGGIYFGPSLSCVPVGTPLSIHYLPWDSTHIHASEPTRQGRPFYLGRLERYDALDQPQVSTVVGRARVAFAASEARHDVEMR